MVPAAEAELRDMERRCLEQAELCHDDLPRQVLIQRAVDRFVENLTEKSREVWNLRTGSRLKIEADYVYASPVAGASAAAPSRPSSSLLVLTDQRRLTGRPVVLSVLPGLPVPARGCGPKPCLHLLQAQPLETSLLIDFPNGADQTPGGAV
ncbi:hypothetical protein ACFFWD_20555 [Bradyrhizobium erythrophlei]|uniref:hypothetical protein n=1 Tax=Bradyrhizobium erythrophlei TaxID=1437360 RepID=UPI0035EF7CD2